MKRKFQIHQGKKALPCNLKYVSGMWGVSSSALPHSKLQIREGTINYTESYRLLGLNPLHQIQNHFSNNNNQTHVTNRRTPPIRLLVLDKKPLRAHSYSAIPMYQFYSKLSMSPEIWLELHSSFFNWFFMIFEVFSILFTLETTSEFRHITGHLPTRPFIYVLGLGKLFIHLVYSRPLFYFRLYPIYFIRDSTIFLLSAKDLKSLL